MKGGHWGFIYKGNRVKQRVGQNVRCQVFVLYLDSVNDQLIIAAIRISTTSTFWLILLTAAATFWIIQILCFSLFTVSPSEAVSDANNYHTNAMHEVSLLGQQHPELSHNT